MYWIAHWNWRAAEDEFRSALTLNPGYSEAYLWYGRHLTLRGRHEAAIENLSVAWKLDPLSRAVNLAIGMAWYAARQFEIASAHFDVIIRENPSWCNALYFAGMASLLRGRVDLAIATLKTAVDTDRTTRRPLVGLAQAYWMAGETQAARSAFDELAARDYGISRHATQRKCWRSLGTNKAASNGCERPSMSVARISPGCA